MNARRKWSISFALCAMLALGLAACGDDSSSDGGGDGGLTGEVRIDGSSTVGPLTKVVAEEFSRENPKVEVTVGESGTGGGFEKFCAGETAVNDASRQIEEDEVKACEEQGIDFEEVQVANDALTIALNPDNPVTCLTVDQLGQIWGPEDPASDWSEVSDLEVDFSAPIERYGPGTDSGTFDYFTEAINGEEGVQTKDYNNVGEDDNQTITGVQGSEGGIGYFGFSFFGENQDSIKAAEVDGGEGCVAPSVEAVQDGTYTPLGRGLFIYPSDKALKDEATQAFVDFYVENVNALAPQVGYIPLTDEQLAEAQQKVESLSGS